jgi:hypothetical protein
MQSKLLYDLYVFSVIEKEEIIHFMESDGKKYFDEITYYDLLYANNEKDFINKLSSICYKEIFNDEIKNKYDVIITMFYIKKNLNIEYVLYNFFITNSRDLLDIDFNFWNLIETDYELVKDGFQGISNSKRSIEKYLKEKSKYKHLSIECLISILAKI